MDDLRTTFLWIVIPACVALTIIDLLLPKARRGIISVYDAVMLSIYLVGLAWGIIKVAGGEETSGWLWIVTAAACFGLRMYTLLNQLERK
jgi:hypothetical protein